MPATLRRNATGVLWGSWRPKIQARSGVPAGCNGGLAARVGQAGGRPSKGWRASARSDHLAEKRALLEELDDRHRGSHLADPEEEHPFDDLCFRFSDLHTEFGTVFLGHERFCEIRLVLPKSHFNALCDSAGLGRLDAGGFEDRKDFDRAHQG